MLIVANTIDGHPGHHNENYFDGFVQKYICLPHTCDNQTLGNDSKPAKDDSRTGTETPNSQVPAVPFQRPCADV